MKAIKKKKEEIRKKKLDVYDYTFVKPIYTGNQNLGLLSN